jgi:hypothetical protein
VSFCYRGHPSWLIEHPTLGKGNGRTYGSALIPPLLPDDLELGVIFSPGLDETDRGWEHVSVSTAVRTPTWTEMSRVKHLFWDDEDVVVQFHPKRSEYVNLHPNCLHLWRWTAGDFPRPPKGLVG